MDSWSASISVWLLTLLSIEYVRKDAASATESLMQFDQSWQALSLKRITGVVNGGLINKANVVFLHYKWDFLYPLSLLLRNTKPIGHLVSCCQCILIKYRTKKSSYSLSSNSWDVNVSGYCTAAYHHDTSSRYFHYPAYAAAVLLDFTGCFSSCSSCSSLVSTLSFPSWLECTFQQRA